MNHDLLSWRVFDGFELPVPRSVARAPSWTVFDGFERPARKVSWTLLEQFVHEGRAYAAHRCRAFPELLECWSSLLRDIDGDPCRATWSNFRPLRVDREEDWSDWLQHFIATSTTGRFAHELFGRAFSDAGSCARPHVIREDVTEDRRADVVIQWIGGAHTQVEVKVGDQSFSKTAETAAKLELKYPGTEWSHYILLPVEDVEHWDALDKPDSPAIHSITWDDVAIALRRSLRRREEPRSWLVWAHGFCGLVEQKLLGHPCAEDAVHSLSKMERRMHQISIMKRGLEDV